MQTPHNIAVKSANLHIYLWLCIRVSFVIKLMVRLSDLNRFSAFGIIFASSTHPWCSWQPVEQMRSFELPLSAWKADMLTIKHYICKLCERQSLRSPWRIHWCRSFFIFVNLHTFTTYWGGGITLLYKMSLQDSTVVKGWSRPRHSLYLSSSYHSSSFTTLISRLAMEVGFAPTSATLYEFRPS